MMLSSRLLVVALSLFVVVIFETSEYILFFMKEIMNVVDFLFFFNLKSSGLEISVNFNFLPFEDCASVSFSEDVVETILI